MDVFKCTDIQCQALRNALEVLDHKGVKVASVVKTIKRVKSRDAPCPTPDYIRKIRDGGMEHPDHVGMQNLWDIVFEQYKDLLRDDGNQIKQVGGDASIPDYFVVPPGKTNSIKEHVCGNFNLYCYSELFNASPYLPCAIVAARLTIDDGGHGVITVYESHKYDGHLGMMKYASEDASGICFQRGNTIYFILKTGVRKTPKFYVFPKLIYNSDTKKIQNMTGYFLKGSANGPYFHSPAYAVRAGNEPFECNILHPDAVDANIVDELNSCIKVHHARRRNNKANRS